jgi:hypothetical protein
MRLRSTSSLLQSVLTVALVAGCGDSGSPDGGGGSGTGGGGTGAAPAAKYTGQVAVESNDGVDANGNAATFSANFIETETFPCARKKFGSCELTQCDTSSMASAKYLEAGDITLEGATKNVKLVADAFGEYPSAHSVTPLFAAGDTLTIKAAGAAIGPFSASLVAPTPIDFSQASVNGLLTLPAASDATVSWTGGTGTTADFYFITVDGPVVNQLECRYPVEDGTGTVPGEALQLLSAAPGLALWGLVGAERVEKTVGEAHVTVVARAAGINTKSGELASGDLVFDASATTTTGTTTSTTTTSTTSGGPTGYCDDISQCEGDGVTPQSGCFECTILGDDTIAFDGGICSADYDQCFGPNGNCTGGGNPACCSFLNCVNACPADNPNTTTDENLNCLCTNNGSNCIAEPSGSTTCFGKFPTGADDYVTFANCVFGNCPVCN